MPKLKSTVSAKRKKTTAAKKTTKKSITRKSGRAKIAKTKKTAVVAKRKKSAKVTIQKVSPIPNRYNSITPYLIVESAQAAIQFYQQAFKAKLGLKMDSPNGQIHHAELTIGDSKLMLADEHPELQARSPKAFGGSPMNIHLYVKNVDKVVERAVAAGATLISPIETMFYGDRCARIEDPYGYQWHIATHVEDVSTRELKKRAAQFFQHGG